MGTGFFGDVGRIPFEGPDSTNTLAFRYYDAAEIVAGRRLEEHLRFAVCYWHNFVWPGGDAFGGQTFDRPWFAGTMDAARLKADVAFEMFTALGVPFYVADDPMACVALGAGRALDNYALIRRTLPAVNV